MHIARWVNLDVEARYKSIFILLHKMDEISYIMISYNFKTTS